MATCQTTELASRLAELLWGMPAIVAVELCETEPNRQDAESFYPDVLRLYFEDAPSASNAPALLASLADTIGAPQPVVTPPQPIAPEDWADAWKRFWHPQRIGQHWLICPSWEAPGALKPDDRFITLDPGAAFGTGTHATTQLMLEALELPENTSLAGKTVLDVGCGSGILAIAAAMLGAQVQATDIDPLALNATLQNAARNHTEVLVSDKALHQLPEGAYDMVLANIVGPVLVDLMPELAQRLSPGGQLYLSGIISSALAAVENALIQAGLQVTGKAQQGDWYRLDAIKRDIVKP